MLNDRFDITIAVDWPEITIDLYESAYGTMVRNT